MHMICIKDVANTHYLYMTKLSNIRIPAMFCNSEGAVLELYVRKYHPGLLHLLLALPDPPPSGSLHRISHQELQHPGESTSEGREVTLSYPGCCCLSDSCCHLLQYRAGRWNKGKLENVSMFAGASYSGGEEA